MTSRLKPILLNAPIVSSKKSPLPWPYSKSTHPSGYILATAWSRGTRKPYVFARRGDLLAHGLPVERFFYV